MADKIKVDKDALDEQVARLAVLGDDLSLANKCRSLTTAQLGQSSGSSAEALKALNVTVKNVVDVFYQLVAATIKALGAGSDLVETDEGLAERIRSGSLTEADRALTQVPKHQPKHD